jgi:Domain of unknown function (DUF2019)
MKGIEFERLTIEELVDLFAEIGVEQDRALFHERIAEFRNLYGQMNAIDNELKRRGRDARLALLRLYDHPSVQVRVKAAIRTLAVAPDAATRLLKAIRDSNRFPQAADAAMMLRSLEDGSFIPS